MKNICPKFFDLYTESLQTALKQRASMPAVMNNLLEQATTAGLTTLHLARLHDHILETAILVHVPARRRSAVIKRAAAFFANIIMKEVTSPNEKALARNNKKIILQLSQHAHDLAASKLQLKSEIARRIVIEKSLKDSEAHYIATIKETKFLKEQLQGMARKILTTQEEERKKISRDLHDVIAQSLMSINVRLATLKKQAGLNIKDFNRAIASTQNVLAKTADAVHRFACGLRPPVLDDMGLIPALHSFMVDFTKRTGVRADLKASSAIEKIQGDSLTVLFRVAQESMTNIERHANAQLVKIVIRETSDKITMTIVDDGKSFDVEKFLRTKTNKLGLLGMRERLEMVGGSLAIESLTGKGTTITATIPCINKNNAQAKAS